MVTVQFPAYREYEAQRKEVNNSIMALLAGAGLAANTLQLTQGSARLLPEIFPAVPHIGRFNLTSEAAAELLASADAHLSAMSVPYVLSLHEAYLKACIRLLIQAGSVPAAKVKVNLASQHEVVATGTNAGFSQSHLQILGMIREMRNCLMHAGALASARLISMLGDWEPNTSRAWQGFGGTDLSHLQVDEPIKFGLPELIATLATTKALSRTANAMLVASLPRDVWINTLSVDAAGSRTTAQIQAENFGRYVRGVARFNYGALAFTADEIASAIALARKH